MLSQSRTLADRGDHTIHYSKCHNISTISVRASSGAEGSYIMTGDNKNLLQDSIVFNNRKENCPEAAEW